MLTFNKELLKVPKGEEKKYAYKECYEELTDLEFYLNNRMAITGLVMDARLDELGIKEAEKQKIINDVMMCIYAQENKDKINSGTLKYLQNKRKLANFYE